MFIYYTLLGADIFTGNPKPGLQPSPQAGHLSKSAAQPSPPARWRRPGRQPRPESSLAGWAAGQGELMGRAVTGVQGWGAQSRWRGGLG